MKTPTSLFDACDPHGVKLLTRLRVGRSHLKEQKFRHNFNDTLDPFCPCNMEVESVSHFFLQCLNYNNLRINLMNELMKIDSNLLHLDDDHLTEIFLYGDKNQSIFLQATFSSDKVKKAKQRFSNFIYKYRFIIDPTDNFK